VAVTANNAEHVEYPGGGELSVEELARRKDVRPVESGVLGGGAATSSRARSARAERKG
jgi:hypothetical protein